MITKNDWDFIARLNNTDLYGLLNVLLKESGEEENVIKELNQVKAAFEECFQENMGE